MKRGLCLILLLTFAGCTTANIPTYLHQKNPYTKRFYITHDKALSIVRQTLTDLGWIVERTTDPSIYEQGQKSDLDEKKALIFTDVRQTALFIGTRYAKMNIYVRSKGDISEIELRYVTVTSLPLRTLTSYRNDSAAERFFEYIAKIIGK